RLWDVANGNQIAVLTGHQGVINSLSVSKKDGTIASAGDGEIRLWDGTTGAFLRVLGQMATSPHGLVFDPSGERLLVSCAGACGTGRALVLDVASGKTLAAEKNVLALRIASSPDGRLMATSGDPLQGIVIWDAASGTPLKGADGKILRLAGTGLAVWA